MGHIRKDSFRQKVLAAVLGGASSTDEVYAQVARHISASRAVVACRQMDGTETRRQQKGLKRGKGILKPRTAQEAIAKGRRRIVVMYLTRLNSEGKIRRVGVGRYAPPVPKIHDAEAG